MPALKEIRWRRKFWILDVDPESGTLPVSVDEADDYRLVEMARE